MQAGWVLDTKRILLGVRLTSSEVYGGDKYWGVRGLVSRHPSFYDQC